MKAQRTMIAALTFGWMLAAIAWGQQTPAEESTSTAATTEMAPVPPRVSARAAEDLLLKRVDQVDWSDKPFEEVVEWLRENSEGRVNVVPRWGPLGVENVNRESLVTLQLNNTTVADVLNEALEQLSEDGEIRFRGFENKLTISTRADFERKMYTKVYDVTDVMFRVPDFGRTAPQIDLQQAGRSGGASGGGSGQSVFSGAGGGAGQQDEESGTQGEQLIRTRMNELRTLIQRSIAPESWDTTGQQGGTGGGGVVPAGGGGGRGRIEVHGRSLVITNSIEVHEMIAGRYTFGS